MAGGHVVHVGIMTLMLVVMVVVSPPDGTSSVVTAVVPAWPGGPDVISGQGGRVMERVVTVDEPAEIMVTGYPIGGKLILGDGWKE